jgi:hypothetical protein
MNNSSKFTADRLTHLKVVVLALVAAVMVTTVGITARIADTSAPTGGKLEATVIKAGKPLTAQSGQGPQIR